MKEEKKIICFDLNGTLISSDFWDMFREGNPEMDQTLRAKYNSLAEFWQAVADTFRKTDKASHNNILAYWKRNLMLMPGGEELLSYLKERGYKTYLVSCSMDECLEAFAEAYGFDGYYAGHHFIFDEKGMVTAIKSECDDHPFKKEKVGEIAELNQVHPEDIIFVGDGANDISAFKLTGHGISMNSQNEELLSCAWKRVSSLLEIKQILL